MYYAVHIGRRPGVYTSWEKCKAEVCGYPGMKHKSFKNLPDARYYVQHGKLKPERKITCFFKGLKRVKTLNQNGEKR
jgi:ribonuclease HI